MLSPFALFGIYTLLLMVVHATTLHSLIQFAHGNPTASQVIAVPFVSIALIYIDRRSVFASKRPAIVPGLCIIAAGLATSAVVRMTSGATPDSLSVQMVGLIAAWIGGFVLFFGPRALQNGGFPLAFLAFTIPPPTVLINAATAFLK